MTSKTLQEAKEAIISYRNNFLTTFDKDNKLHQTIFRLLNSNELLIDLVDTYVSENKELQMKILKLEK